MKRNFYRFKIVVQNLSGDQIGISYWPSIELCRCWYRGFLGKRRIAAYFPCEISEAV